MNILMLSATFPYPPTQGGTQVRTFNLLKYLSRHHQVTLAALTSPDMTDADLKALQEWVAELVVFDRPNHTASQRGFFAKIQRFSQFLRQGTPPSVLSSYSLEMQDWVDRAIQSNRYQVITCEHSVNEIYVRSEWQKRIRTVVNVHSSVYGTCQNQLQTQTSENQWRDRLNLPLLKRYEQRYCNKFSNIVVTTEDDRDQLNAFNPTAKFQVIANGVDFTEFPNRTTDPGGHSLIFIGAMDNLANIDAAKFLCLEILPELQKRYPNTTIALVGARPTLEVLRLGDRPNITVTGRVPAMADYLHRATVCVIPMRTGFGIKNKTLEAMAAGTPIVASDRGLEGLAVDGENSPLRALRANRVEDYVSAIARLFEDPLLRNQMSREARSFVETHYTWERAGQCYEQVLTELT
ncbi:glycosyltransferase family 4 protein [Phormidesmis priestleyi]|uniref:glycosyltransferase family 4 protein n=1 Tax=Phormidesmis priestleyi TaxID=268141 RepID=UPI000839E4CB|nr:glycosyltransferase family 4 protein [Phormidesmis priestleyi]